MTFPYRLKSNTPPNRPRNSRRSLGPPDRSPPSPSPAPESPAATTMPSPSLQRERFETPMFDRPTLSTQEFLRSLTATERRHVNDASASGEFVLNERRTRMVVEEGVATRDFTFEAWAKLSPRETKAAKDSNMGEEEKESQKKKEQAWGKVPSKEVEKEPMAPEAATPQEVENRSPRDAKGERVTGKRKKLTFREQSFKNLYGSFGYRNKLEEKENRKEESSDDEDGDEKLSFGGRRYEEAVEMRGLSGCVIV